MTTPTETAIVALVAALAAKALAGSYVVLPVPSRNEQLLQRLVEVSGKLSHFLNVLDGDRSNPEEMLGADLGSVAGYDITWHVRVEWAVAGGNSATREAAFDAGRKAIWDALKPIVAAGVVSYLGGAVDSVMLVDMLPADQTTVAQAGLPNIKATEFVFALTYNSSDPF